MTPYEEALAAAYAADAEDPHYQDADIPGHCFHCKEHFPTEHPPLVVMKDLQDKEHTYCSWACYNQYAKGEKQTQDAAALEAALHII